MHELALIAHVLGILVSSISIISYVFFSVSCDFFQIFIIILFCNVVRNVSLFSVVSSYHRHQRKQFHHELFEWKRMNEIYRITMRKKIACVKSTRKYLSLFVCCCCCLQNKTSSTIYPWIVNEKDKDSSICHLRALLRKRVLPLVLLFFVHVNNHMAGEWWLAAVIRAISGKNAILIPCSDDWTFYYIDVCAQRDEQWIKWYGERLWITTTTIINLYNMFFPPHGDNLLNIDAAVKFDEFIDENVSGIFFYWNVTRRLVAFSVNRC